MSNELVDKFINNGFNRSTYYFTHVIRCDKEPKAQDEILEYLRQFASNYTGQLFIICEHDQHIHIIHDCYYSTRSCRCRFKSFGPLEQRIVRRRCTRHRLCEFDKQAWQDVLTYYTTKRFPFRRQVWLNGKLQDLPGTTQSDGWNIGIEQPGPSLEIPVSTDLCYASRGRSTNDSSDGDISSDSEQSDSQRSSSAIDRKRSRRESPKKESVYDKVYQAISSLLNKHSPVPASSICRLLDDPQQSQKHSWLLYDPTRSRHLDSAIRQYSDSLINYTLRQFFYMYSGNEPVFLADSLDPYNYYHTRLYSFLMLDRLLNHQFDSTEEIVTFLKNLVSWFNKQGQDGSCKMNTIAVYGDVSAGKNYFFDAIVALAQNVGYFGTVNKTNRFGLQEVPNRRIVVGNEVSIETSQIDNMKSLCEGSSFAVDVKHLKNQICRRTPVILISNQQCSFYHDPAFVGVRIKLYRWGYAHFLAESNKKPYPLAIFDLLNKYKIDF